MPDWMAFNPADYVANTLHLTTRQHGGYILLICAAWAGRGYLPGTDAGLASIAKLSPREWREDGDALKAMLTRQGDAWMHERVAFEWQDAQSLIDAKQKGGREGARRRWAGRASRKANGTPIGQPKDSQSQNDAPQPSPLPCSEEPNGSSGAKAPRDTIFAEGLPWLMRKTGKDRSAAAKIIGGWCRDYGDEAVLAAMTQAERENPVDPVPWIVAKFKPRETYDQRRIREGLAVIHAYEAEHDSH